MAVEQPVRRLLALHLPSLTNVTFVALNLLGVAAYLSPFFSGRLARPDSRWFEHSTEAPLLFAAVAALCIVLVIADLANGALNTKSLAILAVLSALAAVLRTITLPAGANLYFFLVILGAYAFGPRLGFLLGAISLFLSAIVTGGIGPWLPFEMFAAAWMGLCSGLLRPLAIRLHLGHRGEVALLVITGIVWGLIYGAITDLWTWPFLVVGPDISYRPGLGTLETLRHYWNYYLLTSLGWDLLRSLCNAIVIALLGAPLLRALLRFKDRFTWETTPAK